MSKNKDVVMTRRAYNQGTANETLEGFALRFTAKPSRRWNPGFSLLLFGAAAAAIFPLIEQNAEPADFLRFSVPGEWNSDAAIKR
jgi:hypothetical protein